MTTRKTHRLNGYASTFAIKRNASSSCIRKIFLLGVLKKTTYPAIEPALTKDNWSVDQVDHFLYDNGIITNATENTSRNETHLLANAKDRYRAVIVPLINKVAYAANRVHLEEALQRLQEKTPDGHSYIVNDVRFLQRICLLMRI